MSKMTKNWRRCGGFVALRTWLMVGGTICFAVSQTFAFKTNSAVAQIAPDGTLPNNSSVKLEAQTFNITGGTSAGSNLFHSFGEFSIPTGGTAFFNNAADIQNIISRVTGGSVSNIDGLIRANGSANLFLINPNGIIFGSNASLNIGGSFLATTASSFKFPDGSEFSATNPQAPPLLTINVTPGLQYGSSQPGATITSTGNLASKQDLTLVADKLELQGKLFSGRNLAIGSVSGNLANINSQNTPIISAYGNVDIAANYTGASLLVEAKGNIRFGGDINITLPGTTELPTEPDSGTLSSSSALILRSGQNTLAYGDNILGNAPASSSFQPQGITINGDVVLQPFNGIGGVVNIEAGKGDVTTQLISSNGEKQVPSLFTRTTVGGAITLNAINGSISTGNLFSHSYFHSGDGGAITLNAHGNINTGNLFSSTFYSGDGGAITLNGQGNINTGDIGTSTFGSGDGGAITLNAQGNINTGNLYSYASSRPYNPSSGDAGAITLSAYGNINTQNIYSDSLSGDAGAITLNAYGNINTRNLNSYSNSIRSSGDGGAITLNAHGNINTGTLTSYTSSQSGNTGDGGAIILSAHGDINTQNLNSYTYSNSGNLGSGGAISLSTQGNINTQNLDSSSRSSAGKSGDGGAIILSAQGNINTQDLDSFSYSYSGNSGNGGAISLSANSGSMTTGGLNSYSLSSFGTAGNGGAILLEAANSIQLSDSINSAGTQGSGNITVISNAPFSLDNIIISSATFGTGKAGNIQISAPAITLTNGAQVSASTHSSGQGGNITLVASDSVNLIGTTTNQPRGIFEQLPFKDYTGKPIEIYLGGFIPTGNTERPPSGTVFPSGVFSQPTVRSTGNAGNLKIETGQLIIKDGAAIATTTFGKGSNAGNVSINAKDSITVDNGSILSGVAGGARGNSGKIELQTSLLSITGGGVVQTQTLGEGFAGAIMVNATDAVSLSGSNSALRSASGGNNELLGTTGNNIGPGGNISVTTNKLTIADGAVLDATTQTNSPGGDITVNANTLSVVNGGQIRTSTFSGGQAGDITVNVPEIELFGSNSGLLAQTFSSVNAGNLTLQPGDTRQTLKVNFTDGAQISASTFGGGQGGKLTVTAPSSITLSGNGTLAARAEETSTGQAGNLLLIGKQLTLEDGVRVSAATNSNNPAAKGGGLSVQTAQLNIKGGSSLSVGSTGAADAGNLTIQPQSNGQTLAINFTGGSTASASTSGSGKGGTLTVTAPSSITLSGDGSIISAETTGSGEGGNLILQTGKLTVRDGAQVNVSSEGTGNAGSLKVEANFIKLDNQGKLLASTASGEGGNIDLLLRDLILMRHQSLISAQADKNGNGGNITINAPFIVAVPLEGSDIVANAFRGRGGNINITTSGIYGLEYRPSLTELSDINASSQFGVNGTVEINTPGIDPNSGLINLPTVPVDTKVASGCTAGASQNQSRFVVTGRGGLPLNPREAFNNNDTVRVDWVTLNPSSDNRDRPLSGSWREHRQTVTKPNIPTPAPIVEATGWVINDKGEVLLTASPPTGTPHSSWQTPTTCGTPKSANEQ